MNSPAVDVRQFLIDMLIVDTVGGYKSFAGFFPPDPDKIVAITDSPGGEPETGFMLEHIGVQLRMRGATFDYANTYTAVMQVFDALQGVAISDEYPLCRFQQSPMFSEYDVKNRPVWSMNLMLMRTR